MKKILLFAITISLFSCNFEGNQKDKLEAESSEVDLKSAENALGSHLFWAQLSTYCGKAFEGEVVKAPENDDFRGKKLVMHVRSCSDSLILIPFNVGEDRSRTWVFSMKNDRIELKHDHRHEDGNSDEITMYGGTTSNSGLAHIQVFPADQETTDLIPAASANVWWVTVNDSAFTYNLKRAGTDREFTISFDLTRPVDVPEPSWGWE